MAAAAAPPLAARREGSAASSAASSVRESVGGVCRQQCRQKYCQERPRAGRKSLRPHYGALTAATPLKTHLHLQRRVIQGEGLGQERRADGRLIVLKVLVADEAQYEARLALRGEEAALERTGGC